MTNRFRPLSVAAVLTAVLAAAATFAWGDVRLPAVISDSMILQRDAPAAIWGWAAPGEGVHVRLADQKAETTAGADGRWKVELEPMRAGGPFELVVEGRNTIRIQNVMVGEVWLCSGQSNMQFTLHGASNAVEEIRNANDPTLRQFRVDNVTRSTPTNDVTGTWMECSPQTAGGFSAVAYFFGREIQSTLGVPVGLINASWGGTIAEAWTSREALEADAELKPLVDRYEMAVTNYPNLAAAYERDVKAWEAQVYLKDPGMTEAEKGLAAADLDSSGWTAIDEPTSMEKAGQKIDGVVWFHKEVTIPADWADKDLTLSLGPLDDFDQTFFNGAQVGAVGEETPKFWTVPRQYKVPGALVKAGRAVIAVRLFDRWLDGGFMGQPNQMNLACAGVATPALPLAGEWKYQLGFHRPQPDPYPPAPPRPAGGPGDPNNATVLYNGMIHPLIPYGIRGAIWYQGESNAGRAHQYRKLFPAMIRDWRQDWAAGGATLPSGRDFPFLFVQLANFMPAVTNAVQEAAWPELREAQLMTLSKEPNTAMAVIIDVGEGPDIHPKNKQAVGHRLALAARATVYGEDIVYAGPRYDGMAVEGHRVTLTFHHIGSGLTAKGGEPLKGFAVAGADRRFVPAQAGIEDGLVVVWSDAVPEPVAVRYDWANNPAGNLFNKEGLPASPFRTDDWPGVTDNAQ